MTEYGMGTPLSYKGAAELYRKAATQVISVWLLSDRPSICDRSVC